MHSELAKLSASEAARRLLGCRLVRQLDGQAVAVIIVETEAYDQTDAASHSYNGRTQRTEVMFGQAGYLYVYFTYGMHYCCNVVVGSEGHGAAVLIRAVQPISGTDIIARRRPRGRVELTNGPAKLCQALGIDMRMNGHDLAQPPFELVLTAPLANESVATTTRIGISKAKDVKWRYYIKGNDYVSGI